MSNARQREHVGFPRVQVTDDVPTYFFHWRIQVHHLVGNAQLVNKFLHTNQLSAELLARDTHIYIQN